MQQLYNPMGQMAAQQMIPSPQTVGTQEIVINTETQDENGQKINTQKVLTIFIYQNTPEVNEAIK